MTQSITLTKGSISVEIAAERVEQDMADALIKFPTPVIGGKQDTTVPGTWLADFKMVSNTITVTGYLISDSTSTALQKKEALLSMKTLSGSHPEAPSSIGAVWKYAEFTLTWNTETFGVYIERMKITDESRRRQDATSKYAITFTAIIIPSLSI